MTPKTKPREIVLKLMPEPDGWNCLYDIAKSTLFHDRKLIDGKTSYHLVELKPGHLLVSAEMLELMSSAIDATNAWLHGTTLWNDGKVSEQHLTVLNDEMILKNHRAAKALAELSQVVKK